MPKDTVTNEATGRRVDANGKVMDKGTRFPGSDWGPIAPVVPKAKKVTSIVPETPQMPENRDGKSKKARSMGKISQFRDEEAGFDLTKEGQLAYETLVATAPKLDLTRLSDVEERMPGDRLKIIKVMESLALGARHRDALADVGWVWSNFSIYRGKYPLVNELYGVVAAFGEETRKIIRYDEAHRRATEGTEEDIFSPAGKLVGHRIKYSDTLMVMFLKADHPDKFSEKHEVKSTGVVLNMIMGLRENVKQEAMTQSDIKVESPFADEKKEDLPGGI